MSGKKFRAWDKVEKKMLFDADPFALHVSGSNEPLLAETHRNENCIFEQYTGLKDKNGKEIYEGDIVKNIDSKLGDEGVIKFTEKLARYSVYWGMNPYMAKEININGLFIVGNIHENPELLEQKDAKD